MRRRFLAALSSIAASSVFPSASADLRAMNAPFTIAVPDAVLDRIMRRVRGAHLPVTSKGAGWQYGVDTVWFATLLDYWRDGYDWRNAETQLNTVPQFMCSIDGRKVHYAHLRQNTTAHRGPILLLHGWPYSFATMLPLAQKLFDSGFEVVVPSLPGYGLSERPDDAVRGLRFISKRVDQLMTAVLGHAQYFVHGGDHGAVVADWIAIDSPKHLLGVHANTLAFRHAGAEYGSGRTGLDNPTPEEAGYAKAEAERMEKESAYFKLQFTRPETITYALADSPVGWAVYMLDKWQKWTDTRKRRFEEIYGRERLLTEVMLYLVSDSIATSIWPYAGFATEPFGLKPGQKLSIPYGYSIFEDPLAPRPPRRFMERSRTNLRFWRDHNEGGHFPMLEVTDALAKDIVEFVRLVG
jgi:pimeloyl-ACP methyl ester carboxylesterase